MFRVFEKLSQRNANALLIIDNQYVIGYVGATPAFNGIVVVKNYFKNVPDIAPNQSSLQNPGIARTVQFYMEGGKNDSE